MTKDIITNTIEENKTEVNIESQSKEGIHLILQSPFENIFTTVEASKRYNIPIRKIQNACRGNGEEGKKQQSSRRFIEGTECRKSGSIWIVTLGGLYRLFPSFFSKIPMATPSRLNEVVTIAEAAKIVQEDPVKIREACFKGVFNPDEYKNSEGEILITKTALIRVFKKRKKQPKEDINFPLSHIYTPAEGAKLWGIHKQHIIDDCEEECDQYSCRKSKSDGVWLITRAKLLSHFGEPVIPFNDVTSFDDVSLDQVVTVSEAAEIAGKSITTISVACAGRPNGKAKPRFALGSECKKSGDTWIITRKGLYREFLDPNREKRKTGPRESKVGLKNLQRKAKERGGKCLETSFLGYSEKHLFECDKGHKWEAVPINILYNDSWCHKCHIENR